MKGLCIAEVINEAIPYMESEDVWLLCLNAGVRFLHPTIAESLVYFQDESHAYLRRDVGVLDFYTVDNECMGSLGMDPEIRAKYKLDKQAEMADMKEFLNG